MISTSSRQQQKRTTLNFFFILSLQLRVLHRGTIMASSFYHWNPPMERPWWQWRPPQRVLLLKMKGNYSLFFWAYYSLHLKAKMPNFLSLSDLALPLSHNTLIYTCMFCLCLCFVYPKKSCQPTSESPASAGNSRFIVNLSSVIADSECHQRFEHCNALSINACSFPCLDHQL